MKTFELTTILPAPYTRVWQEVNRSELLIYVAKGMISFRPLKPPDFPVVWKPGEYKVQMRLMNVIPIGWQVIRIELPPAQDGVYRVRDNGDTD